MIRKIAGLKLVKANKAFRVQAEVSRSMKSSKPEKTIHPNILPTKYAATKYHNLRAFKQVQQWQGNTLQAADWGGELCGRTLKPMKLWPCPSVTF